MNWLKKLFCNHDYRNTHKDVEELSSSERWYYEVWVCDKCGKEIARMR